MTVGRFRPRKREISAAGLGASGQTPGRTWLTRP